MSYGVRQPYSASPPVTRMFCAYCGAERQRDRCEGCGAPVAAPAKK